MPCRRHRPCRKIHLGHLGRRRRRPRRRFLRPPPALPASAVPASGSGGGTHAPAMQTLPVPQSAAAVQLVRQASPDAAQAYAPHDAGTTMDRFRRRCTCAPASPSRRLQAAPAHTVPLA